MPHGYLINAFVYVLRTIDTLTDVLESMRARDGLDGDPFWSSIFRGHAERRAELLYWRKAFRHEMRRRGVAGQVAWRVRELLHASKPTDC